MTDVWDKHGTPSDAHPTPDLSSVFSPAALPCGLVLPNRLVKVALYEHLAALFGGPPTSAHLVLYARWAAGRWGMLITGNVQIAPDHLTLGRDMVLPHALTADAVRPFRQLAQAMRGQGGALVLMQLNHAGRQSPTVLGGRWPLVSASAPSPLPLGRAGAQQGWLARLLYRVLFPTPREMDVHDIERVVDAFVRGATLALAAGFDGVEVHAAHGYLLAQFISPKSNARTDAYADPLFLLHRIVTAIRAAVPTRFAVGVKISSTNFVGAGASEDVQSDAERVAMRHIVQLAGWGLVDFIEISGGDYENPDFMQPTRRQAFFARFARLARAAVHDVPRPPLILLTGGLRTAESLHDALEQGHADLLGLGRASVLCPDLPQRLHSGEDSNAAFPAAPALGYEPDGAVARVLYRFGVLPLPKLIGAGVGMAWYVVVLGQLARGGTADYSIGGASAIVRMWATELRVAAAVLLVAVTGVMWRVAGSAGPPLT